MRSRAKKRIGRPTLPDDKLQTGRIQVRRIDDFTGRHGADLLVDGMRQESASRTDFANCQNGHARRPSVRVASPGPSRTTAGRGAHDALRRCVKADRAAGRARGRRIRLQNAIRRGAKIQDEPEMVDLTTWTGMFVFAATTGIIAAVLNQVFGICRDLWAVRIKRKSEASYLALRLAAILEGYAYACASFIGDNANAEQEADDEYPAWRIKLPELPPLPEEKDGWHSIDLRLAARVLDVRNHLAGSQGAIDATGQFAEHELGDELDKHAGARGQEAWALAKDLRGRYGLPTFEPVWDFTDTLESALKRAEKAKEERASKQAKNVA
jgi:hypothetical protein